MIIVSVHVLKLQCFSLHNFTGSLQIKLNCYRNTDMQCKMVAADAMQKLFSNKIYLRGPPAEVGAPITTVGGPW